MAHKKIGTQLASDIAERIAKKAFEHLIPTLEEQLREIGREAYKRIDDNVDLAKCAEYGLCHKDSHPTVKIRLVKDEVVCGDLGFVGYNINRFDYLTIEDAGLYGQAQPIRKRLNELRNAQHGLKRDLESQLRGKSTKAAMEAWPEAAGIIASVADVDVGNTMTRPLDALLSRYIPMLSAPTAQGV
jgi:hypothetical protein